MSATDPLLALASVSPESLKVLPCPVARALGPVDKKRRETLRFLVDESGHSAPRIAAAAGSADINLTQDAILKHRRKGCKCLAQ